MCILSEISVCDRQSSIFYVEFTEAAILRDSGITPTMDKENAAHGEAQDHRGRTRNTLYSQLL